MRGFGAIHIIISITLLVAGTFIIRQQLNIQQNHQSVNQPQTTNQESTQTAVLNTSPNKTSPTPQQTTKPVSTTPVASQTPAPTPNPCRMGPPAAVTPDPTVHLTAIAPTSGKAGDTIVLKGSGFGKSTFYFPDPTKFLGGVSFYGRPCGYNSGGAPPAEQGAGWWSDETITVTIPGVSPGSFQVEVTSSDGKRSNRLDFQVLK